MKVYSTHYQRFPPPYFKGIVCLFVALMSLFASKAWGEVTASVSGSTLTFSYSGSGSSAMTDYVDFEGSGSPKRPTTWVFSVTKVIINEGVTTIGSYAFQNCSGITEIHIPTSVTECKAGAFIGCNGLANIYYAGTPNQWASIDFGVASSECSGHPFYATEEESNRSFYFYGKNTETKNIVFTTGLTQIKPYAFYKANYIAEVYIPGTVTTIGTHALDCSITWLFINKSVAPTTGTDAISFKAIADTYLMLRSDATNSYNKTPWYTGTASTTDGAHWLGKSDTYGKTSCSWKSTRYVYPTSGTVNDIDWVLSEDGTLTLTGNGAITTTFGTSTSNANLLPWYRFRRLVNNVVIKANDGDITGISNALQYCFAVGNITVAQTTIPTMTFNNDYTYKKSTDKVKVYVDYSSEGDANLSASPWNGSNLDIEYTTTFCAEPTGLTASEIGTNSATFTWTDNRADTWKYLCLPATVGAPTYEWDDAISTNSKSATISGLNPGSNYVFYVKADCSAVGESDYIYEEFTTECGTIAHIDLPWSENFNTYDNNVTPPCWTQLKSGSGYAQATSYQYRGSTGKSLRIAGGTSSSTGYAVFPQFADEIKTLTLTFYYRSNVNDEYYTYGQAQIGYITNLADKTTFVPIETLEKINSWTKVENFMVPDNTPNGAYFAIRYYGSGSTIGYVHIDDITVREKPACVIPTNVAVSNISNSGATITWDANDMTAWVMQISEGDDEHWGEDIDVATNSKALTGLDDNTLYYVRIKANCGIYGDSEWSDAISFRTECDAIDIDASTPWSEDFNAMSEEIVPECWNNSASTAVTYWENASYFIWGTYNAGSGNKMLRMSNASVDGGIALINTPAFAIPDDGKEYEFMFDYANHASSDLIVKMSVDGSAFGVVNTYHNTGSNSVSPGELTSETISLYGHNGSTVKLQFYTTPASGYYPTDGAMFVDNVGVRKVPTCFQPTALAASSITANSAHLTWTAGASESSWKLQYRASGGEWSEEITVNTTAAKDLESLSANTTYEVRVKAWCSIDDFSEYSEIAEFTTLCAAESMPYSESFGLTTSLPTCWEASSNNWSGDYQGSNGWARLHTGYSGTASLCTPPVDLSEDAILRFKWKNANGTAVNLYISTDRGETKTLISEELSDVQADWATKQYNLSAYTGEEAQFYFIATFSTQNQYAYLDDVEVFAIPTEVFLDNASATDNEDRLEDLMGQIANITINRPLLLNGDYCTLTLPFDLSASQIGNPECPLHGFVIKDFEKSKDASGEVLIYLKQVTSIEAGKPYFVRYAGAPSDDRLTPLVFNEVTIKASTPVEIENEDGCTPHGIFNPYPLTGGDESTLFLSSNNTLYWPSADGTMNGFRAYIKVDATGPLSAPIRRGAPIRIVEQENTATGIESVQPSEISIQKVLRDGQMIIIREGKEYNAQGMRLQ